MANRAPWLGFDPVVARAAWTLSLIGAVMALLYVLRHVLLLLAFSVFFAHLIFPLVKAVQRWSPGLRSRTRAIVAVYLVLLGALVAGGAVLGPRLTAEVRSLAERLPKISQQLGAGEIGEALQRRGWQEETIRQVETFIWSHSADILAYSQAAAAAVLKWLVGAWVIVLIPIFAFFILKDAEAFVAGVTGLFEQRRHKQQWLTIGQDLHHLLGEYIRALVLLSLITFAVWSIVFLVARVPYPVILAALGGALEFVPLLGPVVAGIIVVSVATFTGYGNAIPLVVFIVAWRFIQDYVSSPLVMRRGIEIHPAFVIFGVIAGGELAGPAGMFLSVPVMAGLRILWRHARDARRPDGTDESSA